MHVISSVFESHDDKKNEDLSSTNIMLRLSSHKTKTKINKIKAISALYDIAVLEVDLSQLKNSLTSLSLRESTLDLSEQITIIGYPRKKNKILPSKIKKLGDIQFMDAYKEEYGFLTDHKYGLQGGSGSPVLDNNNQVVGIMNSGLFNFAIATHSAILKQVLNGTMGSDCDLYETLKACAENELTTLHKWAQNGNKKAQYQLGRFYWYGIIVPQHIDKAFYWLQEASLQKYTPAQHDLATLYYNFSKKESPTSHVAKATALYLYKKSAKKQFLPSHMRLMLLYALENTASSNEEIKINNLHQTLQIKQNPLSFMWNGHTLFYFFK